ncbi:hypothetical protein [Rosistilla ulvae]|uniref:hypothetical protein n=1 Tax=Rosistilla ulvae TaxID=1930277 RepID=UPI0011A3FBEA|nr:hypothetical protein [Rosistilla ulvae]
MSVESQQVAAAVISKLVPDQYASRLDRARSGNSGFFQKLGNVIGNGRMVASVVLSVGEGVAGALRSSLLRNSAASSHFLSRDDRN